MTRKFIRNILVVMIELVINLSLVLMKCKLMTLPLSLTNPLHFQFHFMNLNSEVDNVPELLFIDCLLLKFEYCQNHYKGYEFTSEFVESAIHRFSKCIRLHKVSLNHLVFDITIKYLNSVST